MSAGPREPLPFPQLEPDRQAYLQRLVDVLDTPDPSTDVYLAVDAVFNELAADGGLFALSASITRDSSRHLEKLLTFASEEQLIGFSKDSIGAANWAMLIANTYASHVFDACIAALAQSATKNTLTALKEITESVATFADWNFLLSDKYACQSLKRLFQALDPTVSKALGQMKAKLTYHILQTVDLPQITREPHGSSLVQVILEEESKLAKTIPSQQPADAVKCWTLVYDIFTSDKDAFQRTIRHQAQSRLIEQLIALAHPAKVTQIYTDHFRNQLIKLCSHPVANFVVQKLIEQCKTLPQLSLIFQELKDNFAQLFEGRTGVIMKMLALAVPHHDIQKELVRVLVKALAVAAAAIEAKKASTASAPAAEGAPDAPTTPAANVNSEGNINKTRKEVAKLLLNFQNTPKHVYKKSKWAPKDSGEAPAMTSHGFSGVGCQILAAIFQFQSELIKFVIKSFIDLDRDDYLVPMAKDRVASRVLEQFLTGSSIDNKSKLKLVDALKNCYAEMALDSNASHVVDKCYGVADVPRKEKIAAEVASVEQELNKTQHGKFVLRNLRIASFKSKREGWVATEVGNEKKREMFAEIINDGTEDKNKKSKKSTEAETEVKEEPMAVDAPAAKSDALLPALGVAKKERKDKKDKKDKKSKRKRDELEASEESKPEPSALAAEAPSKKKRKSADDIKREPATEADLALSSTLMDAIRGAPSTSDKPKKDKSKKDKSKKEKFSMM